MLKCELLEVMISCSSSTSTSIVGQRKCFQNKAHAGQLLKQLQQQWESQEMCDVVLIAGRDGQRVSAHRIILSASSQYFDKKFWVTAHRSNNVYDVTLDAVHGDALQSLVKWCYTGGIDLNGNNVEEVLAAAIQLQFHVVVTDCGQYLRQQLAVENCLGIAQIARQHRFLELLEEALTFAYLHFKLVSKHNEFLKLNAAQLGQLLARDELNISSEEDVYRALMAWNRQDREARACHMPQLLRHLRLAQLRPAFIVEFVQPLCAAAKDQQYVMDALRWHLLPDRRILLNREDRQPRTGLVPRHLLAISLQNTSYGELLRYCPFSKDWTFFLKHPLPRISAGVAVLQEQIYFLGGRDQQGEQSSMHVLNIKTLAWTQLKPMALRRYGLGVAVLGGMLYAVGGAQGERFLNSVERWDPQTDSWQFVLPMCEARCFPGVAVLDGRLYVIGGYNTTTFHNSVECYDPEKTKWSKLAPMQQRRSHVGIAAVDGCLYVVGGKVQKLPNNLDKSKDTNEASSSNTLDSFFEYCTTNIVECYNPKTNKWNKLPNLQIARSSICCTSLNERLVAAGGYDGQRNVSNVEEYNPQTKKWQQLAPVESAQKKSQKRKIAAVVNIPNIKHFKQN